MKKSENTHKTEIRNNSEGSNHIKKKNYNIQKICTQPDENQNHISENLSHGNLSEKNPNFFNNPPNKIKNLKSQNFSSDFTLIQMINTKKEEKNINFFIKNKYRALLENYIFI